MTDETKTLVEDLRYRGALDNLMGGVMDRAADLIERLQRSAEYWMDDARRYAHNADYWKAKAEKLQVLLREAEVKLSDVQGAYASKQYAANLLTRIRAALKGTSHD